MGTIFKHNGQLIQCQNLQKKLKKMKLSEADVEIIKDDIPNDILEKEFIAFTKKEKQEIEENASWIYYVFKNPKGYYLWGMNKPDIRYIANFGYDISDYKLIDKCKGSMPKEYYKWNPETKTGIKELL